MYDLAPLRTMVTAHFWCKQNFSKRASLRLEKKTVHLGDVRS